MTDLQIANFATAIFITMDEEQAKNVLHWLKYNGGITEEVKAHLECWNCHAINRIIDTLPD